MAALILQPEQPLTIAPGEDAALALLVLNADLTPHPVITYDEVLLELYTSGRPRLSFSTGSPSLDPALRVLGRGSTTRFALTADATLNRFTRVAHGWAPGTELRIVSGTPPAPLVLNTPYYLVTVNADDFQLAATVGGAPIDITTAGVSILATVPTTPANRIYGVLQAPDLLRIPPGDIDFVISLRRNVAEGFPNGQRLRARSTGVGRLLSLPAPNSSF